MQKILIILSLNMLLSCSSINTDIQETEMNNSCIDCGTIVFHFNKKLIEDNLHIGRYHFLFTYLNIKIQINNKTVIDESGKQFGDNLSFLLRKIPLGEVKISYSFLTRNKQGVYIYTGFKDESLCYQGYLYNIKEKELNLELKPNQVIYLKIVKKGQIHQRCALTSFGWVIGDREMNNPFQEVAFEVEKVENIKSQDSDKNDSK